MPQRRLITDITWWAAVAAGPLFWAGLCLTGIAIQPMDRLLQHWQPLLMIVLIYPVLEEIVFRGGIQGWLSQRLHGHAMAGISVANILTSLLFTAMHFIHHAPLWATAVFLPSMVFGFFRDRYQSLHAPIALHIFYNTGYALLFVPFGVADGAA